MQAKSHGACTASGLDRCILCIHVSRTVFLQAALLPQPCHEIKIVENTSRGCATSGPPQPALASFALPLQAAF
eukprot:1146856-Pelagomonas_calceolata.AAC.14